VEDIMSSIGPISFAQPPKTSDPAATLSTDQAADKKARAAAVAAAAQLATDQAKKANGAAVKADEQAVSTANAAVKQDDARVEADGGASVGVNITV